MDCKEFMARLDEYLDDPADEAARAQLEAHANDCPACAAEMKMGINLREALAHLDDDIAVPLPAQVAWRETVRSEYKKRRLKRVYRACGAIAAAFVLMIGCTAGFRSAGILDGYRTADQTPAVTQTSAMDESAELMLADAQMRTPASLEADGESEPAADSLGESAAFKSADEAADGGYAAVRELQTTAFDADCALIADAIDEFNGAITSNSLDSSADLRVARYTVKLPASELDAFLTALDYIGKTEYSERRSAVSEDALATITVYEAASPIAPPVAPQPGAGAGSTRSGNAIGKFFSDMLMSLMIIAPFAIFAIIFGVGIWTTCALVRRRKSAAAIAGGMNMENKR